MNYTYNVDVINRGTKEIVKRMVVAGLSKAKRAKRGVEVNLNSDDYFVHITKQD